MSESIKYHDITCTTCFGNWGFNKWYLLVIIPQFFISFASLIIGGKYIPSICENDGSIISLSSWLLINSLVILSCFFLYIIKFSLICCFKCPSIITTVMIYLLFIVSTAGLLFTFIFNLIGAIQLFSYSGLCLSNSSDLYAMVLCNLIFFWISLFQICFCITYNSKTIVNRISD